MNFQTVAQNLERRGFAVSCFDTAEAAAAYLNRQIDGETVGLGGSVTLQELGLYDSLGAHNQVFWHWRAENADEARRQAALCDVYLSSANGLAETGEIVNIDGNGNRVAATLYGHRRVYLVMGQNKLAPDYEAALHRARNVASPKNAQRLGAKTPCAVRGDRCYDCQGPGRICRALTVLWEPPLSGRYEVVLIGEDLGY